MLIAATSGVDLMNGRKVQQREVLWQGSAKGTLPELPARALTFTDFRTCSGEGGGG